MQSCILAMNSDPQFLEREKRERTREDKNILAIMELLREVGVKGRVLLRHINDVKEDFTVQLILLMHWLDVDDGNSEDYPNIISLDETPKWLPLFNFRKFDELTLEVEEYYRKKNYKFAYMKWTIKTFVSLNLHYFPIDLQILTIKIVSSNAYFIKYNDNIGLPPGFKFNGLFHIHYEGNTWKIEKFDINTATENNQRWNIVIDIYVNRVPEFYLYNVIIVTYLIIMCSASVVAIDVFDYGSRISVNFTALLTLIAFKFVISSWVPQVSYLTLLDKYMLIAFIFISLFVLENFLVTQINDSGTSLELIDRYFALIYVSMWTLLHILIFTGVYIGLFRQNYERSTDKGTGIIEKLAITEYGVASL